MAVNNPKIADVERYRRIRRRKHRSRVLLISLLLITFVVVTLLLILNILKKNKPVIRYMFLSEETISEKHTCPAVIMRDSKVFTAPAQGILRMLLPEASRVAAGEKIGFITDNQAKDELRNLQKAENDVLTRQYALLKTERFGPAKNIYTEAEGEIRDIISVIYDNQGQVASDLAASQTSLNNILKRRDNRLQAFDYKDSQLDELKKTYANLSESLSAKSKKLETDQAGVLILSLDQYEESLTTDKAATISPGELSTILDQQVETSNCDSETVDQGKAIYALTSSIKQYFACLLPLEYADRIQEEDNLIAVSRADGLMLNNCQVTRVEKADQACLLVFRCDDHLESFVNRRKVELELNLNEQKGLRVPMASLLDFDPEKQEAGLFVVDGAELRKIRVNIDAYNQDYALVSTPAEAPFQLEVASMVVLNPESAEEGMPLTALDER